MDWLKEALTHTVAEAVEDIRHKVVEEGAYGRQVTPNSLDQQNRQNNATMWDDDWQMTTGNNYTQDSQNLDYLNPPNPTSHEQEQAHQLNNKEK